MTPEELRAAFLASRLKQQMGVNLDSVPLTHPIQTVPITPTPAAPPVPPPEPYRMPDPAAVQAWRSGANADIAEGRTAQSVPPMPRVTTPPPPGAFPGGGAAEVPYSPKPVVEAAPGTATGLTLNSNPAAPGWAGSTNIPAPEQAAFAAGQNSEKQWSALDQIAKGLKGPAPPSDMTTITPISSQPNAGGQGAAELMAQMLANRRRNYGTTLTG